MSEPQAPALEAIASPSHTPFPEIPAPVKQATPPTTETQTPVQRLVPSAIVDKLYQQGLVDEPARVPDPAPEAKYTASLDARVGEFAIFVSNTKYTRLLWLRLLLVANVTNCRLPGIMLC